MYVGGTLILTCFSQSYDSHMCDPDQFAPVKMIRREFCSLMSLQMRKLVSKETTLTSPILVFICTFEKILRARKCLRACRTSAVAHIYRSCWQLLTRWRVLSRSGGPRGRGLGLGLADIAATVWLLFQSQWRRCDLVYRCVELRRELHWPQLLSGE